MSFESTNMYQILYYHQTTWYQQKFLYVHLQVVAVQVETALKQLRGLPTSAHVLSQSALPRDAAPSHLENRRKTGKLIRCRGDLRRQRRCGETGRVWHSALQGVRRLGYEGGWRQRRCGETWVHHLVETQGCRTFHGFPFARPSSCHI